jgi:hypothetical protein
MIQKFYLILALNFSKYSILYNNLIVRAKMNSTHIDTIALLNPKKNQLGLVCYTCNTYPTIPMQCRTCNTVKCFGCFKYAIQECHPVCTFADYVPMNPQNDAQYQQAVTLRCKHCFKCYNISETEEHERQCKGHETEYNTTTLDEINQEKCGYCSNFYNASELPAHEQQCYQREYDTKLNDYKINVEKPPSENRPRLTLCQRICTFITGLLSLAIMTVTCFYAIKLIFLNNPQFSVVCAGQFVVDDGICLFAFGQFAVGIINISQFGIGLVHVGQAGIGLLFGVGQLTSGIGMTVGQLTSSTYVYRAQIGIAFYAVGAAQCGFEFLRALLKRKSPFVQGCGSNPRP